MKKNPLIRNRMYKVAGGGRIKGIRVRKDGKVEVLVQDQPKKRNPKKAKRKPAKNPKKRTTKKRVTKKKANKRTVQKRKPAKKKK